MIAYFLHQASELSRENLNLRLGLGKIGATGIGLVFVGLNTLGIALVLTWGASHNRHHLRLSSEKVISDRYRPQRIDYSFMNTSKDARKKLKSLNKK
jgi:hypothetical protein